MMLDWVPDETTGTVFLSTIRSRRLASPPTFDNRDLIVALAARLGYAAESPGSAAPVGFERT